MKKIALLALGFLWLAGPAWADAADDMASAAKGFFDLYLHQTHGGIPDGRARAAMTPFISPSLSSALDAAAGAETRFHAANRDSPPLIEGDIFTSLFEGATSYKLGACNAEQARGRCAIQLEYTAPGQKPANWTDTVILVNSPQGWRLDDIAYGGAWDFANQGSLRETLKMVLAEASSP